MTLLPTGDRRQESRKLKKDTAISTLMWTGRGAEWSKAMVRQAHRGTSTYNREGSENYILEKDGLGKGGGELGSVCETTVNEARPPVLMC
mmetsp:Transcript_20148/g.40813  ORF Transcript_20148/g.40813 Transcript_20148/m.40813 type:complete len:90 (+) Transcript_20148:1034-1303(+)